MTNLRQLHSILAPLWVRWPAANPEERGQYERELLALVGTREPAAIRGVVRWVMLRSKSTTRPSPSWLARLGRRDASPVVRRPERKLTPEERAESLRRGKATASMLRERGEALAEEWAERKSIMDADRCGSGEEHDDA